MSESDAELPLPLLASIEREHPEWLEHSRPLAPSTSSASRFLLRLPSPDRRPDLELELSPNEALVRIGRWERLFVWPPEDAEEAGREVIAFVERITRSDAPGDSLPEAARLTDEQVELLGRLDEVLRGRGAVSDLSVAGPAAEPHAELVLLLPPERSLDVRMRLGADAFELDANGAVMRLDRVDFGDEGALWIDACVHVLEVLLENELVLRLRRTLGFRRVGAVRVPGPGGDVWNGDLLACLGVGRCRRISRWWSPD